MKAVILAAGRGTRMGEHTSEMPKPLININGRPFLDFVIENLNQAGISDIGLIVGYKKEMIKEFLKNKGINATLIDQDEPLGTGHAVGLCEKWTNGQDFIVLMGDNLYSSADIKRIEINDEFCYVAGYPHENPEKFGVLKETNGMLDGIIEKPKSPPSNLVNTGLYKFTPDIFPAIRNTAKSERGEIEITDAITMLCKNGLVKLSQIQDYWLNLGSKEDINSIGEFIRNNYI